MMGPLKFIPLLKPPAVGRAAGWATCWANRSVSNPTMPKVGKSATTTPGIKAWSPPENLPEDLLAGRFRISCGNTRQSCWDGTAGRIAVSAAYQISRRARPPLGPGSSQRRTSRPLSAR